MKKQLLVMLMVLNVCGSHGYSHAVSLDKAETREEMIVRVLNLPPEPSANEVDATILGVDVNNNNIRDEVERKIAFDLYDKPTEMLRHMRYAQIWTETFLANGNKELLLNLETEVSLNMYCQVIGSSTKEERYTAYDNRYETGKLLNNSKARSSAYLAAKYFVRDDFKKLPSESEAVNYCSQFDN